MSSARVILNSLNGLFQMSEAATHHMLTVMEDIIIPDSWESIDLIKQTEGLMCTTASLSLTEELLFVHKAQAIVDFCMECRNLWKAFKLDFSPPDGPEQSASTPTPPGTPGHKHPSIHIPTDSHLGLPIRRYIAETLICHVLGQPSYALACLLVSATTQNLEIKLPNKQLSIEDVCKLANDHCQTALPMPVIQHARTLFSQHDVAWREGDKVRRLMTNIENTKLSLQRMRGVTARFQWLHEEKLILPDSPYPWVGTQRSVILTTIKKVLATEQMSAQLTSVQDKINSQQFRISQRLQWAAGANPALNSIVDEFERCMKRRKQILQEEEDMYNKIYDYCEAVIHLESSHTRVPQQTNEDKETITIIQRCADATVKLQLCAEQLSHVSDILPYIEFPEDGGPLTLDWMHSKLEELTMKKSRILNEKRADNTKLAKHKESVLSELEKLRGLNRAHRKLMLEIWPHLTALARLEEPPPPGQVQPGPRAFINLQNRFGDEVRSFIQSTQELIASDMSLAAKPTWTSRARVEEFAQMRNAAENLRVLAECLLGQLLSFTDQLFQGQPCGSLRWNPPPMIESMIPKSVSMVSVASQAQGNEVGGGGAAGDPSQQQQQQQQTKIYRSSQGIVRDKRTGKALQEQNSYAVGVWRRVKAKLDGRDPDSNYRLTVSEQVKFVIDDATSLDNLCQLYEGWTPWV